MRIVLLLAFAMTGVVLPVVTYRESPVRVPVPPRGGELPDQVLAATHGYDLHGCPVDRLCDLNRRKVTIVVAPDALRLLGNGFPLQSIARDGREWDRLRAALPAFHLDRGDLMVMLADAADYQDLLEAMLFAHGEGFSAMIAQQS